MRWKDRDEFKICVANRKDRDLATTSTLELEQREEPKIIPRF